VLNTIELLSVHISAKNWFTSDSRTRSVFLSVHILKLEEFFFSRGRGWNIFLLMDIYN
jgi:hypothetical protein